MAGRNEDLMHALDLAAAGDWESVHLIVQRHEGDGVADWLHALLHKLEGDTGNSRYWYLRTRHSYEEFSNTAAELAAIRSELG
jgi:hypothetical protein